jgi:hypothetical protein
MVGERSSGALYEVNTNPFTCRESTFIEHLCSEARSGVLSTTPGADKHAPVATAALLLSMPLQKAVIRIVAADRP